MPRVRRHLASLLTVSACWLAWGGNLASGATAKPAAPAHAWLAPDETLLQYTATPPLEARKLSSLEIRAKRTSEWIPVGFDATMPSHGHGMNVQPSAPEATVEGWKVKGIKLHMPGPWLLRLKVKHAKSGEERWLEQPFLVPF